MKYLILVALCSLYNIAQAEKHIHGYSIRNTYMILNDIVQNEATFIVNPREGADLSEAVFSGKNVTINGVEYFLNAKEFSKDLTFEFDIFRFFNYPVYVPRKDSSEGYETDEASEILTSISRRCPTNYEILCGLECCSMLVKNLQWEFMENKKETIKANGKIYTTNPNLLDVVERMCKFQPYTDSTKKGWKKMTDPIYYGCLHEEYCHELQCIDSDIPRNSTNYRVAFASGIDVIYKSCNRAVVISLLVFLVMILISMLIMHYLEKYLTARLHRNHTWTARRSTESQDSQDSQDTQLSVYSDTCLLGAQKFKKDQIDMA